MLKRILALSLLLLQVLFTTGAIEAKTYFITVPSLSQREIPGHENYCGYYALHNVSNFMEHFGNTDKIRSTASPEDRATALQNKITSRENFSTQLALWKNMVASHTSDRFRQPRVGLGDCEVLSNLIPTTPSLNKVTGFVPDHPAIANAYTTNMVDAIKKFKQQIPVGIWLGLSHATLPQQIPVNGGHAVALGLLRVGDDIEIYYMDSENAELTPDFKKQVVTMVKSMASIDLQVINLCAQLVNAVQKLENPTLKTFLIFFKQHTATFEALRDRNCSKTFILWLKKLLIDMRIPSLPAPTPTSDEPVVCGSGAALDDTTQETAIPTPTTTSAKPQFSWLFRLLTEGSEAMTAVPSTSLLGEKRQRDEP